MTSFEKKTLVCAAIAVSAMIGYLGGIYTMNSTKYYQLQAYEEYYQGAEELLDTLDAHYDWADSYDVKNYYKAVSDLKNNK